MKNKKGIRIAIISTICLLSACGSNSMTAQQSDTLVSSGVHTAASYASATAAEPANTAHASASPVSVHPTSSTAMKTVSHPEAIDVLVNKQNKLPEKYTPADLVYADVRFTFKEKIEKRKMRKEAAVALKQMFAAADQDHVPLAGVSAYRSHARQKAIFEAYVRRDGEAKARTYSAYPGTSEHETGLAIDVSGSNGRCAATGCFAGTKEAKWLAQNAASYGFIIRYPKGKESITGYTYEPWHLRYVGKTIAGEISRKQLTLEEYKAQQATSS
ncbi:M15 family metallopeptidase [Paenibacillus bovis]|uniref:D-alanyl-D-alanine carboxypeptidase n=1 Tax=Paenibacillus bovis TaxID=1616788 RepID=A0A172ZHC2_9BACL|nr:M15 family metallopeptidase [Paenibacillus bovis]ANF97036.1 D-alanyl-D-alanine carboxypeptidase [Paenibacillus bovis]